MKTKDIGTKKIRDNVSKVLWVFLGVFVNLLTIVLYVFLVIGATASILLLYKMFPETALILYGPSLTLFSILFTLCKSISIVIYILLLIYIVLYIGDTFKDISKDRDIKREKFMNEIVGKLKKEMKNK